MKTLLVLCLSATLAACAGQAKYPITAGYGPNPNLPPPKTSAIPVVHLATATGWPGGVKPVNVAGTTLTAFAAGLDHPRWLYVLPNGDVLVAETNAPERPEDNKGVKGKLMKQAMKKTGAAVPSANRITLLRDVDGDGVAEVRQPFMENLKSPFGMALVGDTLYVANADALVKVPYETGALNITATPVKVCDLPGGPINHHWTKNVIASEDGTTLFVAIGSNSNIAENGITAEEGRAAIWAVNPKDGTHRVFASGLRNPVGLAWNPNGHTLWTVVNERDELGNDLPPDYLTSVKDGGFYGWPYSYHGRHVDERVQPQKPELVAKAITPDYALGAHTASLGLAWSGENKLGPRFAQGMFIGQHGSWNRNPRSGYKVLFVPFEGSRPDGEPIEVLTGFVNENDEARGRPVGVAIDKNGGLLVADDVGNVIWRVGAAPLPNS